MIIEIKGFAIPKNKICSISAVKCDDKKRFIFDIKLDNTDLHRLTYSSAKEANIARDIIIKAIDDKKINISEIIGKANANTAKKAIDELLKELYVKDIAELKEICK